MLRIGFVGAIFAALAGMVSATYTYIAGYEPQSNVEPHAAIDLDVRDIISHLPENEGLPAGDSSQPNWGAASQGKLGGGLAIYNGGHNSIKSSGAKRNIKGFSTSVADKKSGNDIATDVTFRNEPYMKRANAFWKTHGPMRENDWADAIIQAAFSNGAVGPVDFGTKGGDFRRETIQKGIVYLNVLPYVLWEMQDAINDCRAGDRKANGGSVHAWDEAVAFWTGSAEGTVEGGDNGLQSSTDSKGYLMFALAEKRCKNYGTCTADFDNDPNAGYSAANKEIFRLFQLGEQQVLAESSIGCDAVVVTRNKIVDKMMIPLIQGTLRYLYKTNVDESSKEAGELFAFGSAILPAVYACDNDIGELLYDRVWKGDKTNDYAAHKANLESVYGCLGVTCADIGDLTSSDPSALPACADPELLPDQNQPNQNEESVDEDVATSTAVSPTTADLDSTTFVGPGPESSAVKSFTAAALVIVSVLIQAL